ncbi:MAG: 3-(cis-5,6-dihydroxycyclohexa-1,3-dien-1-yl)propanoate dehydrogenase [Actinobacteria bacterium]|nr:MAG: 3-(cis-5,6-dihydroxycyclohexa-1,3-dien-1-yl)propanoate dehydrogenase [Actinomycetota bacterium]
MGQLEGEVALVTGGGSGLGRAVVERFVEEGARVGVLEKSQEKAEALTEALGDEVVAVQGDVTIAADNQRAVDETVKAFGKLDCLVGNAGVWDFNVNVADVPLETLATAFDELFGVNVKGYVLSARAAVPALKATHGSMIFTVSNAGFYPGGGGVLYTTSKHAVMGMVKQLAWDLAPEIRVNGVAPGGMITDLRGVPSLGMADLKIGDVMNPEMAKSFMPLGFMPEAEDYVGHFVLLANRRDSRTATGTVHNCDGGIGIALKSAMQAMMESMGSRD